MESAEKPTPPQKLSLADIVSGFRILLRFARPYTHSLVIFVVFGIFVAVGNALLPYLVGTFVDALVSPNQIVNVFGGAMSWWIAVLLMWAAVRLLVLVFQDHIWRYSDDQGVKIFADYLAHGLTHIVRLPLSFHKTNKIGEIATRIGRTAGYLERIVANTFLQLGPQVLSIVAAVSMTFVINAEIAVMLMLAIAIYTVFFIRGAGLMGKLQVQSFEEITSAWGDAGDYINNARQVKEMTAEPMVEKDLYQKFRTTYFNTEHRIHIRSANLSLAQEFITYLAQIFIFVYSAHLIFQGSMTIGELLAVNGYALMVFGPFDIITRMWKNLQNGLVHLNETEKILALPVEELVPAERTTIKDLRGDVTFDSVSFGYNEDKNILKDISFSVKAGETIAIVGESGVGKTTLVDLILGFHMPTKGIVYVDDVPTDKLDLRQLRKKAAIVTQEITLFNDTITKNLTFGLPNISKTKVSTAAKQASAQKFIEAFPEKWNQLVGERGIKLSGGQRQRIAIARAILKDPTILILDEPTSALDARTEFELQKSLEKIMKGKTTFVIAHRFSTVRNADRIIVLKNGTIVEQGTHDDLLAQDGEYRHLYDLQIGLRD